MQNVPTITVVETAKMVRKALKAAFASVDFRVKTYKYSGGSHITVNWVDGPTVKQVQAITSKMDGSVLHIMEDYSSRANVEYNGVMTYFAHDGINLNRAFSVEFLTRRAAYIANDLGVAVPQIKAHADGTAYIHHSYNPDEDFVAQKVMEKAYRTSAFV